MIESSQTAPASAAVVAHHEAGHAVAAIVLGIPFKQVRIIPDEKGRIGVSFTVAPWISPRPEEKLAGFTDEEWEVVSRDDAKWQAWQRKDNDGYAIFMLAGKAAEIEYAGTANDEHANADYSFVEYWLPRCYQRLGNFELDSRELVRNYWPVVEAVAAELLKKQVLAATEVEHIFRRTMPHIALPKPTA